MSALAMTAGMLLLGFPESPGRPPMRFRDIGRQAGLATVPNFSPDKCYVIETTGGGIDLFDCDDDGKLDMVVTNDSTVDQYLRGGDRLVTLYHQEADLHFTDITRSAGLKTRGWGMAVAVRDFDNDGLPDLYVPGYGRNVLYRNRGGVSSKTSPAAPASPPGDSASRPPGPTTTATAIWTCSFPATFLTIFTTSPGPAHALSITRGF